jgi:hypothetical protein
MGTLSIRTKGTQRRQNAPELNTPTLTHPQNLVSASRGLADLLKPENRSENDPQSTKIAKLAQVKISHATPGPLETRTRTTKLAQMAPASKSQAKSTSKSTSGAFKPSSTVARTPPQPKTRPVTPVVNTATKNLEQTTPTRPNNRDAFATPQAPTRQCEVPMLQTPLSKPISKELIVPKDAAAAMKMAIPLLEKPYSAAVNTHEDKVTFDMSTFAYIGQLLNVVIEYVNQPRSSALNSALEMDIKEIKETLRTMTTNPRTWAEVAAQSDFNIKAEMAKRERLEAAKRERGKSEILISFQDAPSDMKEKIEHQTDQELRDTIEHHIHKTKETADMPIQNIQKLSKHTIKIQCRHENDAQALCKVNWNELDSARMIKPMYGVKVDGVAKSDINPQNNDQNEMKEKIENTNNITVARVALLTKKPKNPSAPTHSIVIFTECPNEADNLICSGLKIMGRIHSAKRFVPQAQLKQCYNCQGYGHKAYMCTRQTKCGKCAGDHETRKCEAPVNELQCTNCKENHAAWHHECSHRIKEYKRLRILEAAVPPTFGTTP